MVGDKVKPIYVGVLYSTSGVTAVMERSMLKATEFAIDEVNEAGGINGREMIPIHYDPASIPAQYGILADRLITQDEVSIIFGGYMSSSRKAILPIVQKRNALLCYPAQYEGFEYSNNIIYTGAAPNQNSIQLAYYLLNHFGSRFYMVGSDYIWPRESDRIMRDLVEEVGGEIVGEQYRKLDATREEFDELVEDIKLKQPDVIFANFAGESIVHFYQAYADAGLSSEKMPIASLTTSETDIKAMGVEYGVGHITSATYFQTVDSEINRSLVKKYKSRYGEDEVTNMCWEAAYFQVHIVAEAMRRVNTDAKNRVLPAIKKIQFNAPQGLVYVDACNSHTNLWPRIGRVNEDGLFTILLESSKAVHPDPYLVAHSLHDWTVPLLQPVGQLASES